MHPHLYNFYDFVLCYATDSHQKILYGSSGFDGTSVSFFKNEEIHVIQAMY